MNYGTLYDLIRFLQHGTRLHIGVILLGNFGGEAFALPRAQTLHDSEICWHFKNRPGGTRRCFRCRQAALRKARQEKKGFGGLCINGVYEYTYPVMVGDQCVAVIYVGNVYLPQGDHRRLFAALGEDRGPIATMEQSFSQEQCQCLCHLIARYLLALHRDSPAAADSPLIANVKAYACANLEYNLRLSDVAEVFHYHPQYLGRRFQKETGMSFCSYLNGERLARAAALLKQGARVLDAANRAGFNNLSYFNRLFKLRYGYPPSHHR